MHTLKLRLAVGLLLLCLPFVQACAPLPAGSNSSTSGSSGAIPAFKTQNTAYLPNIHTVQLYPGGGSAASQLQPAVMPLAGQKGLILHFDDLQRDRKDYLVRIVHCNYNWEPSRLSTLEYLQDYNEFPITDFSFSFNTLQPYVHYQFEVPRVKLPGNYVLVVYRNRNPNDLVLTQRFMVYENQAPVTTNLVAAAGGARFKQQQIDLEVFYRNLPDIVDPINQIKVVIRQNQRWDNAVVNLRPSGNRTASQQLEYQLFDQSNAFPGGNEFRFFDLRTVRAYGQYVGSIKVDSIRRALDVFLQPEKPRARLAYASREDINGDFIIENQDYSDPDISGEYAEMHFFLKTDAPYPFPVYVAGDFSNYQSSAPYTMQYDAGLGGYSADMLLKQGWYNYLYLGGGNKENSLAVEGTHSETENFYEIFVYYRPNTKPADMLVGYSTLRTGRGR